MARCEQALLKRVSLSSLVLLVLSMLSTSLPAASANSQTFRGVYDEASCNISAMFAFGDSMTDTGNAQTVFSWQHAASLPPYGETYFGEPRDRFSDGRLLIDFLAQAWGLPLLDPYLRSVGTNFKHGANFATSGATVTNITFLVPYDFGVQAFWLDEFRNHSTVQHYSNKGDADAASQLPAPSDFDRGLYMVAIGGNDYDAGVFTHNMTGAELTAMIPRVVAETLQSLRALYQSGARNMLVVNIPPIGCTPELLSLVPQGPPETYDQFGCHIPFNTVLSTHNRLLRTGLLELQDELKHARLTYVDYYTANYDLSRHGDRYHFVNRTHACCGWGGKLNYNSAVGCGTTTLVNGVNVTGVSCADPNTYINWDGIHPTEAFAKVAAKAILAGNYIEPANAFDACKFDFSKFDQVWEGGLLPGDWK